MIDAGMNGTGNGTGGASGTAAERPWQSPELRRRLVAFARRFVRDAAEAEDIAQETLFRAASGRARLRSTERAEAWLFRICRHAAIDHVRSRRVRRAMWGAMTSEIEAWATEVDPEPVDSRTGPDLCHLPAHHRLLMVLYYQRGLSQATLCRLTGLSASALRVRLFRARGVLAEGVRQAG
jgi:RNA polymerase sigma-70 factor (ECF subfamily)